jgi:hypothetical protein
MSPRKPKETDGEAKPATSRKKAGSKAASVSNPVRKSASPSGNGGAEELRARIARRAYELYAQRGYQAGHDFDDWIQAEREVLGR